MSDKCFYGGVIMPQVGEIKRGYEIGKLGASRSYPWETYEWARCSICGRERWVTCRMVNKKICNHCNGHIVGTRLRGEGKWYSAEGYVCVRVLKSSKFFPTAAAVALQSFLVSVSLSSPNLFATRIFALWTCW